MANRILEMADKIPMADNIGAMADRILPPQVIQNTNIKLIVDAVRRSRTPSCLQRRSTFDPGNAFYSLRRKLPNRRIGIMYLASTKTWYLERLIRFIWGLFVLGSVLLGHFVHPGGSFLPAWWARCS